MTSERTTARKTAGAFALLLALALSSCGVANSSPTSTTTSTTPKHVDSIPAIRARYLAIVNPANAAFARFVYSITKVGPDSTAKTVRAIGAPAALAVKRSGQALYALRSVSPAAISADLLNVVKADNTIYQGIEDLMMDWGSRAFSPQLWSSAFASASATANSAGNQLRVALGLSPEAAGAS